jgi:hypothetical protein
MTCSFIPVTLKLTTSDETLFSGNDWIWKDTLYWTVQCLSHRQNSISPIIIPHITPDKFKPVPSLRSGASINPLDWNFCLSNSDECNPATDFLLIVFTFNPSSTDPNDFEQFVVDVNGSITYHAPNSLLTAGKNRIRLDIEKVDRSFDNSLLEIWLAKGSGSGILLYNGGFGASSMSESMVLIPAVIITILIILFIIGIVIFAAIKN